MHMGLIPNFFRDEMHALCAKITASSLLLTAFDYATAHITMVHKRAENESQNDQAKVTR